MLLTFCSCSRRDCRHPRRLLLRLKASFSAAGERSAMSGKFREGLAGAMLPGLSCRRPRAALCTRQKDSYGRWISFSRFQNMFPSSSVKPDPAALC
ncbi:hypothetical protein R6Z07F_009036 [Ovis aries]